MSTEMKKLIIGGTEYEIVDDAGRTRITALEQGGGGSGTGLTQTEKNLLLSLFEKAAYAEDDAGTAYTALSNLWTGYSITWSGTGYTKSNSAIAVSAGASFTSTVTANTGFTLTDVAVTMGGNTVQGAWSNGTVTIPTVTGDIVITVTTSQITVSSISAVYSQSGTVYDTASLDSLKTDLVVTATFNDSSTGVINAEDYTLSGTLAEGTSTITVSYGGKTDTFDVTVTEAPFDTTPIITDYDKRLANGGTLSNQAGMCVTDFYELNDSKITIHNYYTEETSPYSVANILVYDSEKAVQNHWNGLSSTTKTIDFSSYGTFPYLRFSLYTSGLADCYCYETNTGKVLFAGENSPYYGMHNISEASS